MFTRTRDWAARALLPIFLLSLGVLWYSFAEATSGWYCASWRAESLARRINGDARLTARVNNLVEMVQYFASTSGRQNRYLFFLLVAFALARVLLARERLAIRVPVFLLVLIAPVALVALFGSIC